MNIEVEIRSEITKKKYDELEKFFTENGSLERDDYQESFYIDCEEDLRIQKNKFEAKIWLKKGKMHDDHREEVEIHFDKNDFEKMERIFTELGYGIKVKWFRNRKVYSWEGITVCLDDTRGFGPAIELEKMCSDSEKQKVVVHLREKLKKLGIEETPKEIFKKKCDDYTENWKELTGSL